MHGCWCGNTNGSGINRLELPERTHNVPREMSISSLIRTTTTAGRREGALTETVNHSDPCSKQKSTLAAHVRVGRVGINSANPSAWTDPAHGRKPGECLRACVGPVRFQVWHKIGVPNRRSIGVPGGTVMGKLVVMRTSETGWDRVGETANGGTTPKMFMGLAVGACGNLDPAEKQEFNESLHAQGMDNLYLRADKISAWSHANGVQIEVEHTGKGCAFFQRIS